MILYSSGKEDEGKHFHFLASFCLRVFDIFRSLVSASWSAKEHTSIKT